MSPRHLRGRDVTAQTHSGSEPGSGDDAGENNARFATTLVDSIGGWKGMVDSGLPVVVFVIVNALSDLTPAIWAAVAAGIVVMAFRLVRRESLQQAVGGFVAVAVAAYVAHRTGQARDYFLLGIWRNAAFGVVLAVSVVVRWPLVGTAWEYLEGRGSGWRSRRGLARTYGGLTLMWAAVFLLRFGVQLYLYHRNETGWLAGASLAMGYPLFAVAAIVTVVVVRRVAPAGRMSRAQAAAKTPARTDPGDGA